MALGGGVTRWADPRIDLRVLLVTDGSDTSTAYQDRLSREGIPFDVLDLHDRERPKLDEAYLTTEDPQAPHGKYNGIILPSTAPEELSTDELDSLHRYESSFGVRQISAYVLPGAEHGMRPPHYSGEVDGMKVHISEIARTGDFGYLRPTVALDDTDAAVSESYGYLAEAEDPESPAVVPLVTATVAGSGRVGVLTGIHRDGTREELFNTFASNQYQHHFNVLAHGQLEWLTQGVHLGHYGHYFSVHSDDVLMADAQWTSKANCTYAHDCEERVAADVPVPVARMTVADVDHLRSWQRRWNFPVDLAFNGAGSEKEAAPGGRSDSLLTALRRNASEFRWINHTYTHRHLGCVSSGGSPGPANCAPDDTGAGEYVAQEVILEEITANIDFAARSSIPLDASSVVTGEHSGLRSLPDQPEDNPHLASALADAGIAWIASDASREKEQRALGPALTVPRYPMNIFYNVSTEAQQVDEYNWMYTSRADGGSGMCESGPGPGACIAPLPIDTGFASHIVPTEARVALGHVLGNDPRPHYVHQSNQTGERILYPVLEEVLSSYRSVFADSAPLLVPTMAEAGTVLRNQSAWSRENAATGVYWMGKVYLFAHEDAVVPLSLPVGAAVSTAGVLGTYAHKATGWLPMDGGSATTITLGGHRYAETEPSVTETPHGSTEAGVPGEPDTTAKPPVQAIAIREPPGPRGELQGTEDGSGGDPDSE
ncbi:hypothetical protein [Kocuria sp. SM24M-10]|uniref:hypothetical protein n=1 Tax=Kocuria sp. SM24M-10 TaxID=1660349 RepID=UPI00069BEEF1|nr:hypothetical protein [Kocuria sp. SM24M-10]